MTFHVLSSVPGSASSAPASVPRLEGSSHSCAAAADAWAWPASFSRYRSVPRSFLSAIDFVAMAGPREKSDDGRGAVRGSASLFLLFLLSLLLARDFFLDAAPRERLFFFGFVASLLSFLFCFWFCFLKWKGEGW